MPTINRDPKVHGDAKPANNPIPPRGGRSHVRRLRRLALNRLVPGPQRRRASERPGPHQYAQSHPNFGARENPRTYPDGRYS